MKVKKLIIKDLIRQRIKSSADLAIMKRKLSKKYKIPCLSNIQLLKAYHKLIKQKRIKRKLSLEKVLTTRPIRSLSGIVNVSLLTKDYPCPGKCLYCPIEKGIPKSYLSGEPAVQRAQILRYNPYLQVAKRIEMLEAEGHPTDKIDLRIIGGTWSYYPKRYQNWFVKRCFDAANEKKGKTLLAAQKLNEKVKHKLIGISVETRPDFIDEKEVIRMRNLGITKVELGVQSIWDDVLKINLRGHKAKETIQATKLLKDAGFKVSYQVMPNLLGSSPKKDIKMFKDIFSDSRFKPDLMKIYPCALLEEAPLYNLYLKGKYKPYSKKTLIGIIKKAKTQFPFYVRIERITRDIPSPKVIKGPAKITNLRQVIKEEMKKEGKKCKCIRCREIKAKYDPKEKVFLFRQDYEASGGKEIFLSFENKRREKLYSLLRLRIPSYVFSTTEKSPSQHFLPVLSNAALIREIHTYGQQVAISERKRAPQHRGLGKKLIKEAEKISGKEFSVKKIAAISGIGARNYWRKLGYVLRGSYMIKKLKQRI